MYQLPKGEVVYNLRYFLPHPPAWGSDEFCNGRVTELLQFCQEAGVNAVQFYVNTQQGSYYLPARGAAEQAEWVKWMREQVVPPLRTAGISYQLNFQSLLGHASYGLDVRSQYGWEFLMNEYGEETFGCGCPIGPRFREIMGECLRLWASTKPDILWIDDDFRMHNHGMSSKGLDMYCFCDNHLARFTDRMGKRYSREELRSEIVKPGEPSELRLQWLDFLGDTMVESSAWIKQQVCAVSPETRLALMTSDPDVHSAEGRKWPEMLTALCGDHPPMTRPPCGIYTETISGTKELAVTYRLLEQSVSLLDNELGRGNVEYGPEVENTRYTTWSKSVACSKYMMTLGQLVGCNHITLAISDLDGSAILEEPTNLPMLRDSRAYLEALAALRLDEWDAEGVVFVNNLKSARALPLQPGSAIKDMAGHRNWDDLLLQCSIPAHYLPPAKAAASDEVVALDEFGAWSLSDDELRGVLSHSALLDSGAARVACDRGFSDLIGAQIGDWMPFGVMAERYVPGILPGISEIRVPHRGRRWREITPGSAKVTSYLIDEMNRKHVASTIFENQLGGRVAVYAHVGDFAPAGLFASHARLRWLRAVLDWLSRNQFGVMSMVPHHCLTVVRKRGNEKLIALANLGADALVDPEFRVRCSQVPTTALVLDDSGTWLEKKLVRPETEMPEAYTVTVPGKIGTYEFLVARIEA